jgi:hypothetical protein
MSRLNKLSIHSFRNVDVNELLSRKGGYGESPSMRPGPSTPPIPSLPQPSPGPQNPPAPGPA